jgi:hypothetical protein
MTFAAFFVGLPAGYLEVQALYYYYPEGHTDFVQAQAAL